MDVASGELCTKRAVKTTVDECSVEKKYWT
jgi:hypothetical protein